MERAAAGLAALGQGSPADRGGPAHQRFDRFVEGQRVPGHVLVDAVLRLPGIGSIDRHASGRQFLVDLDRFGFQVVTPQLGEQLASVRVATDAGDDRAAATELVGVEGHVGRRTTGSSPLWKTVPKELTGTDHDGTWVKGHAGAPL